WSDNLPGTTLVRSVLDSLETPVFWKDARGRFLGANKAFLSYFDIAREQIVGKVAVQTNTKLQDFEKLSRIESEILSGKENEVHESVCFLQKNKTREAQISYSPLTRGERIIGLVGSFLDVTEANESKRVLEKLASFDYLTGMKNRRMFFQALNNAAKKYQEGGDDFAVLMMDLDSFKEINDTFGHDVGDQILVEFSRKAAEILQGKGELYRLGGDEFIALVPFEEKAEILATKDLIQSELTIVFDADGHELKVVSSLGFAIFGDYLDTDILMREADKWMYRDKFLKKAKR
ncbi:MAG: diguanylate cyclase, partial [Bacilli bacterium]|nr:diguanylate cyclase [Bacilli bacterium]